MEKIYKNASWDAKKIMNGFKHLLFVCFLFVTGNVWGQTTLISPTGDGGFENGSTFAANGWTVVNHTTNIWAVGSASTSFAGSNAAFISNNGGTSWAYTTTTSQTSHFYRDITVPAGETKISLTFQWKGNGESGWDRLLVYTAPTSVSPVAGTPTSSTSTLTGATLVYTQASNAQAAYTTTATISLPASLAGTTFRLIYTWQNDGSGGTSPGISMDNILLTSEVPASYTWNATSGSAAWATAANWTPARTTPSASDILNFSNGGSSNVQTASGAVGGNIVFSNNTTANFQPTATNTLTLSSLNVPSGSSMFLNGTTAQTIAFSSGATNSIGGRLEVLGAAHSISFANSVTTVTTTGTLAAGGATAATITGTTSTLIINGTYEHKYTSVSGTIPTASWAANSNCNIIGYTAASMVPAGIAQTFGNFTWNCTGQGTNNYNLISSSTTTIQGTLSILSTGTTGSLRWTSTGGYTLNANNYAQSAGNFDLSSGTSGSTMSFNVSGAFNQTGGTFLSSGTSTNNPTVNFNGTTNQSVTFATQPTGPITYRISNPAGITLTGPSANFTIGNGTLGGLRISTTAANPIAFGGTTTALSYNAANSTLTYDATIGNTTARATEFPATSGPASLTVAVGSGNVLSVPFSRTVRTTLTMTSGDIDISSNALTLGTSTSALGTLTYSAGAIRVTSGTFTRWFGTTGLPTAATTSGIGFYPIASVTNNRNVGIYFSSTGALSTGGTITVGHTNAGGLSSITSFADGAYNVDTRTNPSWTISTGNGIVASGTLGVRLTGGGALSTSTVANLRLIQASAAIGTHVAGTGTSPNFQANRSGLSLAQIANTHYIGAASADIQSVFNSVASGDWNNGATWDVGSVPTCTGLVNIMNGHNVTVNSTGNKANTTTVNVGGTLTVASGDITVGCTNNNTNLINNGTLTVSGGTLNVNGSLNHNAGATFNQSGGDINIDGNSGSTSTSATSYHLSLANAVNWTGGTLTVVDPHASATATDVLYYNTGTSSNVSTSHTLKFGDGSSTHIGGNVIGFRANTYAGSGRINYGSLIINGGTGTNRIVTGGSWTNVILGDLTINSNSEYAPAQTVSVAGNIVNNGVFTQTSTTALQGFAGTTSTASTNAQTIGGSGTYRNASTSPSANIASLTINNSNATGVTLNVPLSISGTLTMTSGIINTTSTNILRLGTTTAVGTLSGTPSNTNFINGPFARTFAASRTSSAFGTTTLFPVGVVGATPTLMSMDINPVTNATGPVIFTVQANNSMSGSAGSGVSNLASVTWSAIPDNTANLTSAQVRLNRADASVTNNSKLLYASNNTDPFEGTPGGSTSSAGASISGATQIVTADYKNHFSYGDLVVCTAPGDQASNFIASNKTTTSFTANFNPASSNPTGYLVVRYTGTFTPTAPVDGTLYASGSALGGTVVGNYYSAPFTFNQTSLAVNSPYTYKIYSFNNTGCAGPAYNATSYDETITTCATSYSAPTSISASNITTTSMDINFTASTTSGVLDHYIDVATNSAFTNFVSGFQNLQINAAASAGQQIVNITGLSASTTYYVRIKATDGAGCESSYSTTLTQATECNAITTLPHNEYFTTYLPSNCWNEGLAGDITNGPSTISSTASKWTSDGFLNNTSLGAARINIYSTAQINWLISPSFTIPSSGYRLKYSVGATQYGATTAPTTAWETEDSVCVMISTSGYSGWSILKTFKSSNVPSHLGQTERIDLSAYSGQNIRIAFMGVEGATDGSSDIDFFVDSFIIEQTPAPTITSVTSSNACGGNTKIVIIGSEMNDISTATIGSQSLLPFDSTSSTRLVKTISTPLNGTTSITNNIATATNGTTITFVNAPALSVDSPSFTICSGSSATVKVTSTLTDYSSYTWSPATGVSGTTSATFNPTATTTYTLSASNTLTGCSNTLTRTISVNEIPSTITLSQGRTTAKCFSALDSLEVSGGLISGSANIGTAASTSAGGSTSSTLGPNPMQSYYGGTKMQMLYLASELSALGMSSGSQIFSLTINMPAVEARQLLDYTVKSKLTSASALTTTFESGLNTNLSIATFQPVVGVNTLTLTTPITWDGTSNLLFDFAFSNNDGGGSGTSTATFSSTAFVSTSFYRGDNITSSVLNSTTTATYTYSSRNNTTFSFSRPATYSWSPTAGLFTNRAMTTAYTGTSVNKVYSKPSATQYYYLTATNGACSLRDSIVDSVKNATNLITLASSTITGAVEQCSDANGWTYYATAAKPDEWLFGIYKNGNNFTATVDINVDNTNKFTKSASSNGANQEHASYILSRYWNVNATGTVGSGVKVRFFIDPQDITDLLDERDNDYDVLKNNTNPSTLAVTGGFEWFKTTGTTYNPSNWTGNKHNGAIVKLTQDTVGELNGQTYVELSGITSFSGGSGGSSFGPSSNGLFNSGGTVGLPVTWKEVKATAKETGNLIQWATSSEKNTKSFVVEYSYDAKEFFEASKDILAAGNSATERFYEFNHDEEYGELVYYRIKQIDLDGKMEYSKAVVVKRTSKLPEFNVSMYPVPLNVQDLNIRIQTVQKTDISISINDLLGRNVYSETIIPAGYNTNHKMNLSHLPQGTYHVTINNGINKSVQVLVVGK